MNFYIDKMPFLFWSAALFYAGLAVTALAPGLRRAAMGCFAPAQPENQSQIAPMDSFRGLAALWVFALHVWMFMQPMNDRMMRLEIIGQGRKAVPVFAVLSGFLVYRSIRNKCGAAGEVAHYAKRRFLRIYPLYLVTLIAGSIVLVTTGSGSGCDSLTRPGVSDVFMLRVFGYPSFNAGSCWNGPVWSLYVEAVFYILLPVFLFAARGRVFVSAVFLYAAAAVIALLSPFTNVLMLAQYFLVGIILCEVADRKRVAGMGLVSSGFVLLAGTVLFLMCVRYNMVIDNMLRIPLSAVTKIPPRAEYNFPVTLGVAAWLLLLGTMKFKPMNWLMSLPPLRFLGVVSYSVYMWHAIFLRLAVSGVDVNLYPNRGSLASFAFLYLPAMLFYASVSYALIERPFNRMGRGIGKKAPRA